MRKALTLTLISLLFALATFAVGWWAVGKDMSDMCASQAQLEACE